LPAFINATVLRAHTGMSPLPTHLDTVSWSYPSAVGRLFKIEGSVMLRS